MVPEYINTLIIAVIFIFLGLILGKLAEKLLFVIIREIEVSAILKKTIESRISIERFVATLVKWLIAIFFFYKGFAYMKIEKYIILLAVIIFIIFIVTSAALFLSESIPNFIAGLKIRKKLKTLKSIEYDSLSGMIEFNTLTHTIIKTKDGDTFSVPHSVLKNKCMTFI